MGIQDRDWYRDEQRRKRELVEGGRDSKPHRPRPPMLRWMIYVWNVLVGYALAGLVYLAWKHFF